MNYENLNVPPIKDLEFAADFFAHYLKFQEYIKIEILLRMEVELL